MARTRRPSPGGVGDGLPALPSGEPLLHRWFVLGMIPLVVLGLVVTVWAFVSFGRDPLTPAERRPPGTSEVTHERGQAALADDTTSEAGPSCAPEVQLVGDAGGRSTGRRALSAACQLLARGFAPDAAAGLQAWREAGGVLRVAVFEVNGLDSSTRVEDGRVVIELNAKFQFEDATRAAPALVHELTHLGRSWPGAPVTDVDELAAVTAQLAACDALVLRGDPPRGCLDARALLDDPDPLGLLGEAGYRAGR